MKKKNDKNKKIICIVIISILIVAIIGLALYYYSNVIEKKNMEEKNIAYTELLQEIEKNTIEEIKMESGSNTAKVKFKDVEEEKEVTIPNVQAFIENIQNKIDAGNEIKLTQNPSSGVKKVGEALYNNLALIILLLMLALIMKMQGFGGEKRVYDGGEKDTKVRFDDVAGLDEEKGELIEIVDFLKNPEKFTKMGAKVPRGILLCGKPGTGKTLIAKAVAGEAKVPFISMSGSEFIELFAGLGASRVRRLFEKAKKMSPCIIFIDEIDAIGSRRTSNSGAESENNQTLNQLLVEMDGFETDETVIVLAATNRPEMLDKALLRPGRFDRQVMISTPDVRGREEILKIHAKNKKFDEDVDLKSIAEDTAGFTGAELANILNEAAIHAAINNHRVIDQTDIDEAVKKVTVGLEKNSRVISEKDKKLTAYHEAGHAIVSKFLDTAEQVKEISIVPRGVAGGYTMYKNDEDKFYVSKTEMKERLICLLGGRAAENIALNDISTGASNDIEVATKIARDMVTIYGMSSKIGPISLKTDNPYELELFGEDIERNVGEEIKELINEAYNQAQLILKNNREILDAVANVLLIKETISQEEFKEFFK